jgi:hypothetical protein
LKAFCRRFCVFFADFVPKEYKNAARRQNRRAAERSFLFECFILLGFRLTPQGIGITEGYDVDGLHQTVAHPEHIALVALQAKKSGCR